MLRRGERGERGCDGIEEGTGEWEGVSMRGIGRGGGKFWILDTFRRNLIGATVNPALVRAYIFGYI